MRQAAGRIAATVALMVVAVFSVSCSDAELDALLDELLNEVESSNTERVPADAGKALKKLEVSPPGSMAGYGREDFPHWSDA